MQNTFIGCKDPWVWFLEFEAAFTKDPQEASRLIADAVTRLSLITIVSRRQIMSARASSFVKSCQAVERVLARRNALSLQPIVRKRLRTGGQVTQFISPAYCRRADCSMIRELPLAHSKVSHDNDNSPPPLAA